MVAQIFALDGDNGHVYVGNFGYVRVARCEGDAKSCVSTSYLSGARLRNIRGPAIKTHPEMMRDRPHLPTSLRLSFWKKVASRRFSGCIFQK